MKQLLSFRAGRIGLLWTLLSLFFVQTVFPASFSNEGNSVSVTPFDRKISNSHAFESSARALPGSSGENPAMLFLQAKSFRYASDRAGNDHWQTPEETNQKRSGDCEDKAVWLYAKLKENGYTNARLVIGKYKKGQKQYHVWVTYSDANGDTFILDPAIQTHLWKQADFFGGFYVPYYSYDGQKRYSHKTSRS